MTLALLLAATLSTGQSIPRTLTLPTPVGPFLIGTKIYHWTDRSRQEKASHDPTQFRQLVVQVWYPAEKPNRPVSPYVPELRAYRKVWTKSQLAAAGHTKTHSHPDATPVSAAKFPIVLLSHGWQGTRSEYTILAENLASQGYAVFGIDHPYMGWVVLRNGQVTEAREDQFRSPAEVMEYYGGDVRFVVDQVQKLNVDTADRLLVDRLELTRIAAIGHSSGFSAVSTACRHDPRIRACINVDAPGFRADLLDGLNQPLLWIRLEKAGPVPEGFAKEAKSAIYELQIKHANHGSVEDWDYLLARTPAERQKALSRLTLIHTYIGAFLGKTLAGATSLLLKDSETSEIRFRMY